MGTYRPPWAPYDISSNIMPYIKGLTLFPPVAATVTSIACAWVAAQVPRRAAANFMTAQTCNGKLFRSDRDFHPSLTEIRGAVEEWYLALYMIRRHR